ncbi:tRNA glutamyl-Q(34) synthetase GluQRS [Amaricoccus sp.]|uniref:tRNA glutamyl-Q(34) synthetase GluQRS n=1 Tax=Amaricoccus sp. TaxID=1872485 RepID=UPI001B6A4060|nr:tRNA glutamyl-Q(34) synthetase GluQRS [Amaricoccus sp.]MBP7240783.1 tRNA glutamyl-Q(34) synthetase GluQRS [Amaricoccus sp.]
MRTRFAPSPTGRLHLGHAFSALVAADLARAERGEFLLRIEDIDRGRCRPEFEAGLVEDLRWLGLTWPEPPLRQSARAPAYAAALDRLRALGLLYACRCTRRDIALSAPQEGAEGPIYPGTCRGKLLPEAGAALRLDLRAALAQAGPLAWHEVGPWHAGARRLDPRLAAELGDPVLARKDLGVSYHLAVVVDDAAQAITHVVRGEDLRPVTPLHRLLQALLDLPTPVWLHHRLVRDEAGRRLAKRDDARALATLRADGVTPAEVRAMVGL